MVCLARRTSALLKDTSFHFSFFIFYLLFFYPRFADGLRSFSRRERLLLPNYFLTAAFILAIPSAHGPRAQADVMDRRSDTVNTSIAINLETIFPPRSCDADSFTDNPDLSTDWWYAFVVRMILFLDPFSKLLHLRANLPIQLGRSLE